MIDDCRDIPDPFDTSAIRDATRTAWSLSPHRLMEDCATESDLADIGYRDRLWTELAANAADAAHAAGVAGKFAAWCAGNDLHVANTGLPLSAAGVKSLAALRVSGKASHTFVGRFGIGFTAVATVCDAVSVRSRVGSVKFSRSRTAEELGKSPAEVPMLRLVWPESTSPTEGFDTEIVLHNLADPLGVLNELRQQASTLLLELLALESIAIDNEVVQRWVRTDGEIDNISIGSRQWFQVRTSQARWLMSGTPSAPQPTNGDVLHAPTRTDVELTLPAICIADVAVTSDRRGLHPTVDISAVAPGYHRLALACDPTLRLAVIPRNTLPGNAIDAHLREAVLADLARSQWLPTADGGTIAPVRAVVVPDVSPALATLLAEVIDGVVSADISDRGSVRLLTSLGVHQLSLAQICEQLAAVSRDPDWWRRLYGAIEPLIATDADAGEIATLPVPRSDGRMSIGARGVMASQGAMPVPWLTLVHPDADHRLLDRIGLQRLSVTDLLTDATLRQRIDDDSLTDDELTELAEAVLALLASNSDAQAPQWLSRLLLVDSVGQWSPADELLLPDGPLAEVLIADAPFGSVDPEWLATYGVDTLRRVGVAWGFTTVVDELPTGPDHDLADEEQWWDSLEHEPHHLIAVRDLDLIDPTAWHRALSLLVADANVLAALDDRNGYTAWWLRRFAEIDGVALGHLRAPDDESLIGLVDVIGHRDAPLFACALAGVEIVDNENARIVLGNLADERRDISGGVGARAHAALVRAVRAGRIQIDHLDPPTHVRSMSGAVTDRAVVIDEPGFLAIVSPDCAVVSADGFDDGSLLAAILDIDCARSQYRVDVTSPGHRVGWASSIPAMRWSLAASAGVPAGDVCEHPTVSLHITHGRDQWDAEVSWWVDDSGTYHFATSSGLGAAAHRHG